MMQIVMTSLVLLALWIISTENPMKLCGQLLGLSALMSATMWFLSSSSWIPILMFLLFAGGIMIIFMIVSSISPNEMFNPVKLKSKTLMTITILGTSLVTSWKLSSEEHSSAALSHSSSKGMIFYIMVVITMYFVYFVSILESTGDSMRSNLCGLKKIL